MEIISSVDIKNINESVMMELIDNLKKKINEFEIDKLKKEIKGELDENKKAILAQKMIEIKRGSVEYENN
jgi:hypothetical protein